MFLSISIYSFVMTMTGKSSEMTMSSRGVRGGDAQESDISLLTIVGTDMSHLLRHVDAKRAEAMEVLFALFYNRHRRELLGNYPDFIVVMVIYHYVERIWRILVTPNFCIRYIVANKYYPGRPVNIHIK